MIGLETNTRGMTDEEFRLLRDLIYDYCGIYLPESVKFLMERRLRPRLPVYDLETFRDYYRLVRYGREPQRELDEIVDRITTNETYFFRGESQLRAFTDEIVPSVLAGRDPEDVLRVWSAGCSSGEEPYTLAMLLNEDPRASLQKTEIFGHDISRKVLRTARDGVYRPASFRQTDKAYLDRYFTAEDNRHRLSDRIRKRVQFGHLNLLDRFAMHAIRDVDIVFCRNVIIYFAPDSRSRLLANLLDKMRPGGYLILGHSESLINASTGFQLEPLDNDIVYRKPKRGV